MLRLLLLLLFLGIVPRLFACSAFVLQQGQQRVVGKNFDWIDGSGYLLLNPRGETRYALPTHAGEPLHWTSLYGSVTFNQHGKNQPYGGMNEKGLVVEMLWLEQTAFPSDRQAAYVNELELIQLLLDRCQHTEEALRLIDSLRIYPLKGKIHYLISDGSGQSALVDFLNGKAYLRRSEAGQCIAVTNNADYYARAYRQRNPDSKPLRKRQSLPRFVLLNNHIGSWQEKGHQPIADQAKKMLRKTQLRHGFFRTRWSALYLADEQKIRFRHGTRGPWLEVALNTLDFGGKLLAFPLDARNMRWQPYTAEQNQQQLQAAFAGIGLEKVDVAALSRHQFGEKMPAENSYSTQYALLALPVTLDDSLMHTLRFRLYDSKGFPDKKTIRLGDVRMRYSGRAAVWQFPGIAVGEYAVVVFQDTDRNKKPDNDPHAISRDHRLQSGTWPAFGEVSFRLPAGPTQYPLHIRR